LDVPSGAAMFAEVELKGKKKEVVAQCALKACQILDKHGALRQSHQGMIQTHLDNLIVCIIGIYQLAT